ncbi:MAG: serine/threonine protein kinase, partial [Acutalibacteraceae bacterium]
MKEMLSMLCPNCFCETNSGICPNCNYNQNNARVYSNALPAFSVLNNRYKIGRVLGRGGFGITYVAIDLVTNEIVAIKECVPDAYSVRKGAFLNPKPNCTEQFNSCIRCFLDEKDALMALKNNPGVVNYIDSFSENNTEYFVMEFINGVTLKYLITKNGGILPFGNSIYIFLMIGSVLMDVHRNGILHRDISPENIMISSDGSIKLIDFGAVKNYFNPRRDDAVFLKPGFAPPEQYSVDGNQGPWTDIYALGATFYTIVSGQPLIDSKTRSERDTIKPLSELECGISEDLSEIIEKSMALEVSDRY